MTEPALPPHADVLGAAVPAEEPKSKLLRNGLLAAAVVGVLGVSGAAVYASTALSGGGTQPEDVLPSGALGFLKLDLDPAAGQKVNLFRIAQKFPEASGELESAESLRDDLLRRLLEEGDADLDYDRDVAPWIGDRFGVAALPSGDEEPDVVAALAYTDRDAAEAALAKAVDADEMAYVLVEGFVLFGDSAEVVDKAAAATDHLADDAPYQEAVDALDGDQIALAWADVGRVWDAVPAEAREEAASSGADLEGLAPSGQAIVGLRAESDAVELVGRTLGLTTGLETQDGVELGGGAGIVRDLPAQSLAAVSIAGLGQNLASGWTDLADRLDELAPDVEAQAEQLGLSLPEDLATLFGDENAVGVWGDTESPQVQVRTRTEDPEAALSVLERVFEASGAVEAGQQLSDYTRAFGDGYLAGTPDALVDGGDTLGGRPDFERAVPDPGSAGFVLWISLQDALTAAGQEPTPETDPLDAVGVTASGGADGEFRIRLTFR